MKTNTIKGQQKRVDNIAQENLQPILDEADTKAKAVAGQANNLLSDATLVLKEKSKPQPTNSDSLGGDFKKPQTMLSWLAEKLETLKKSFFNMFSSNSVSSPVSNPERSSFNSSETAKNIKQNTISSPNPERSSFNSSETAKNIKQNTISSPNSEKTVEQTATTKTNVSTNPPVIAKEVKAIEKEENKQKVQTVTKTAKKAMSSMFKNIMGTANAAVSTAGNLLNLEEDKKKVSESLSKAAQSSSKATNALNEAQLGVSDALNNNREQKIIGSHTSAAITSTQTTSKKGRFF